LRRQGDVMTKVTDRRISRLEGDHPDDDVSGIESIIYSVIGDDLQVIKRFVHHKDGTEEDITEDEYQAIISDPDTLFLRWSEGEAIDV